MDFKFKNTQSNDWKIVTSFGIRQLSKKGLLAYEYNPLKVLRYKEDYQENGEIIAYKNELSDLDTDQFNFDLHHPVQIEAQESYDGTVNLILNDNKNIPRMINTRFSCIGNNSYEIINRTVDSNIYNNEDFDIQTSLYKRVSTIPKIHFRGLRENGNLKVGNYIFYFKLADGDGNETDWIGQSSIVSCHLGSINNPLSIRGGMEDENSYKQVDFVLTNLDSAYSYVTVYYTRTTSSQDLSPMTTVHKVNKLYNIINKTANVLISGFETTQVSSIEELNAQYIVVDAVKTQTQCDNMLFFGNVKEAEIDYEELTDLSLRITPELTHIDIGHINQEYKDDSGSHDRRYEYYNVNNIYNYLGYWDDDFYRFGVVYILNNYTLSPVFNIRGINELTCETKFNNIPIYKELNYKELEQPTRNKIIRDKEKYTISYKYLEDGKLIEYNFLSPNENSKGVLKINYTDKKNPQLGTEVTNAIGFNFNIPEDLMYALEGKIKGLFIVRQRRNPTTMCQAVPILTDKSSKLPALPVVDDEYLVETMVSENVHYLTHDFNLRKRYIPEYRAEMNMQAAICPDYTLDQGYFNKYFTGSEFILKEAKSQLENDYFQQQNNHLYTILYEPRKDFGSLQSTEMYVTSIPDATYSVKGRLRKNWFAAAAGEEADPLKVSYVGYPYTYNPDDEEKKNIFGKVTKKGVYGNTDYVTRGFYGPYIGLENKSGRLETQLYNIKMPKYSEELEDQKNYIEIRCRSAFPFYAISPRFSLEDIKNAIDDEVEDIDGRIVTTYNDLTYKIHNIFGGDCYIGNFTTRMNRNFANPEAPNNNIIIDGTLWGKNYRNNEMATGDHNKKIILGDIYAVQMGHFATVKVCSNFNLAFRSTDPYIPAEVGLTGHKRSFYPYTSLSSLGSYKIPESFLINSGLNKTVDEKYNIECPDVPAIKNNFSTRVLYSDISVKNSFTNGYRIFRDLHYQDYSSAHGELVSLIEKAGDIFCTFEHATGYLAVAASQLAADQKNATVFITTANVLPDTPYFLNSEFGSQWQESVIKTPTCIYGVDTVAKRIWRVALEGSLKPSFKLKTISDFKIQRFLNENITLGEYETTPTIGIRNVKTHYNAFKGDIMFTFYDDVDTIEEKAWNLCFNEPLEKFITFYSWVPSYSENIDNIYFSFDRDTSKYMAKLYSDPSLIKLEGTKILKNISDDNVLGTVQMSKLSDYPIWERHLKQMANNGNEEFTDYLTITYEIVDSPDSSLFNIPKGTNTLMITEECKQAIEQETEESRGRLYKLPIKVTIDVNYNAADSRNTGKSRRVIYTTFALATEQYYKNLKNTSFWKHGYAGLMETRDDILPTKWYGKQHPFEFEFIVAENQQFQKIFNTLQLIANKAKPESFHFEVVGESYTFADEKKNIFWRQEALKHIYQWNNGDITYDRKYEKLEPSQRKEWYMNYYDKSTLFPLYYHRNDTLNEIYDSYQNMTSLSQDYQNMIGTEVVYDKLMGEFKLQVHTPARCMDQGQEVEIDAITYDQLQHETSIPVKKEWDAEQERFRYYKYINYGRRLGNCHYKEDEWYVQIPPILYAEKNEDWQYDTKTKYPPLNVYYTPIQESLPPEKASEVKLPTYLSEKYSDEQKQITKWWQFEKWQEKQTRLRDKFIRIKVRYSGEDLAIIYAIKTMYTISYS